MDLTKVINRLSALAGQGYIEGGQWNANESFCIADIIGSGVFDPSKFPGENLRDHLKTVVTFLNDAASSSTTTTNEFAKTAKEQATIILDRLLISLNEISPGLAALEPNGNLTVNWASTNSSQIASQISSELSQRAAQKTIPYLNQLFDVDPLMAIGLDPVYVRDQLRVKTYEEWINENKDNVSKKVAELEKAVAAQEIQLSKANGANGAGIQSKFESNVKQVLENDASLKGLLENLVEQQGIYALSDPKNISQVLRIIKTDAAVGVLSEDFKLLGVTPSEFKQLISGTADDTLVGKVKERIKDLNALVRINENSLLGIPSKSDIALLKAKIALFSGDGSESIDAHLNKFLVIHAKQAKDQFIKEIQIYGVDLNRALEPHIAVRQALEATNDTIDLREHFAPQSYREILMFGIPYNHMTEDDCIKKQEARYIHRVKVLNNPYLSEIAGDIDLSNITSNNFDKDKLSNVCEYSYRPAIIEDNTVKPVGDHIGDQLDPNSTKANSLIEKLRVIYDAAMKESMGSHYNELAPINSNNVVCDKVISKDPTVRRQIAEHRGKYSKDQISIDAELMAKYGIDDSELKLFKERFDALVPWYSQAWHTIKQFTYRVVALPGLVTFLLKPLKKYGWYSVVAGAVIGIGMISTGFVASPLIAAYLIQGGLIGTLAGYISAPLHNIFAYSAKQHKKNHIQFMDAMIGGAYRLSENTVQKPAQLIATRYVLDRLTLPMIFPNKSYIANDLTYYDVMYAREYGHNVIKQGDNQNFVRQADLRDFYPRVSEWIARGWGRLSPSEVNEVRKIVELRGIPTSYYADGRPNKIATGKDAWTKFQERYGEYGKDTEFKTKVIEPVPDPRDTDNPLAKVVYTLVRPFMKGDAIDKSSDENLGDYIMKIHGKEGGVFFNKVLDTKVRTSPEDMHKALKDGNSHLKAYLSLPQATYGDNKTKTGYEVLADRQSPLLYWLADSYEEKGR
jgi:hypothetical protein